MDSLLSPYVFTLFGSLGLWETLTLDLQNMFPISMRVDVVCIFRIGPLDVAFKVVSI